MEFVMDIEQKNLKKLKKNFIKNQEVKDLDQK